MPIGTPFILESDHDSLKRLQTQKNLQGKEARWLEYFQQFDMKIVYKPGKENVVADALSRRPDFNEKIEGAMKEAASEFTKEKEKDQEKQQYINALQCNHLYVTEQPAQEIIELIQEEYMNDQFTRKIWNQLQEDQLTKRGRVLFAIHNGVMYANLPDRRVIVVPDKAINTIIEKTHSSMETAHTGSEKLLEVLRRSYYWPKMAKTILKHTSECLLCQQAKPITQTQQHILQSLPIAQGNWEQIAMDWITGLPADEDGFDAILVVIDSRSKMAHFIPTRKSVSATETAMIFLTNIVRLHGLPSAIISDRDSKFTSAFWENLTMALGIKRRMSSSYHPESDGQTERTNRTLEHMLRAFTTDHELTWQSALPMVEFAYNNTVHSSTGYSPFFLNYGKNPRIISPIADESIPCESAEAFLQRMAMIQEDATERLQKAQNKQQQNANKSRVIREFNIGEWVMLNTTNLPDRYRIDKLAMRFIGPYQILAKKGEAAYQLDLPHHMSGIHHTFYVGQLKPFRGNPPAQEANHQMAQRKIEKILAHKRMANGQVKLLIQWLDTEIENATWHLTANLIVVSL